MKRYYFDMQVFQKRLDELNELLNKSDTKFDSSELLRLAEEYLNKSLPKELLHKYLNLTKSSFFLSQLKNRDEQYRWAETAFKAIRASDYSLYDLMKYQVENFPDKILFSTFTGNLRNDYSYKFVYDRISKLAAALFKYNDKPVAAIYSDNCIEGALTDLACLTFDIFVSPLNSHFNVDNLQHIYNSLKFNIVLTDSPKRVEFLKSLREKTGGDFLILFTGYSLYNSKDKILDFEEFISSISSTDVNKILSSRKRFSPDDISTVMFTSGSTGVPKGVAFTNYNIIAKRFARGAALPQVGRDEVLLCYLPLYHTFGRYFEMLGTIYWGGNYVFAGKNDVDSLLRMMKKVKPTGFISIPLRWKEIYDRIAEKLEGPSDKNYRKKVFRNIVGENLRWGISAAGYLEPKVFNFFNSYSVELCSGFGMTEATGGISMTIPGKYVKDSVGIPLPGIKIRFSENGELEFSGHYAAKYLDGQENEWIKTGDLFIQDKNGNLFIVDRLKDIYKNMKGQTIAPAFIEKKFENIPGLKRAFLVGDGKPYNTLLITPEYNEPFIKQANSQHKLNSYFGTLVSSINKTLKPFERIIKFAILNRDFDESKGELTSKGTFKRKIIGSNFKKIIDELYAKPDIRLKCGGVNINLPVWALKDLGITEYDLNCTPSGLINLENGSELTIKKTEHPNRILIGNFEYITSNEEIDLGIIILQPVLWLGNKELIEFFICKEEWDADYKNISSQIYISKWNRKGDNYKSLRHTEKFDSKTRELNNIILKILYGSKEEILSSLNEIEILLAQSEYRINNLLSRRVEALATHPEFSVRSKAYKILLFNKPDLDYNKYFPSFINSGLSFINKKVIDEILKDNVRGFNLDAFRKRLEAYRKGLKWPADLNTRNQFKRILELLVNFLYKNPSSYNTIRIELVSWILHKDDPHLSKFAQSLFNKVSYWFEKQFKQSSYEKSLSNWKDKILYQDNIPYAERMKINRILSRTTFLKEAFMLIYDIPDFDLKEVEQNGIYISPITSSADNHLYRLSINTKKFKHYDLVILLKPDITKQEVMNTIYLMIKISRKADGTKVLPVLGNFRIKAGIISFEFINDLTVWERIRMINSSYSKEKMDEYEFELKLLFTRGMTAFFNILKNSDYKIIPGNISPANAVVPEPHFSEGSLVLSITGWKEFKSYKDFFSRLLNNFYQQTVSHYPLSKNYLKTEWLFDACIEATGTEEGLNILSTLKKEYEKNYNPENEIIYQKLSDYIEERKEKPYINTYIISAIKNYNDWIRENPSALKEARENFVNNLFSLYRLDRYSESDRYIFYMNTYYSSSPENVKNLFSKLIKSILRSPDESVLNRIELVELLEVLKDETDKRVLNKLIFPFASKQFALAPERTSDENKIIIKTQVKDNFGVEYIIRNPLSAFETASLYKLFILDSYPLQIDASLQFLLLSDIEEEGRIIGGACYKIQDADTAHLEGIVISKPYRKRGLAALVLNDLSERLKSNGIKILTTHYYLKSFYEKIGFETDARWGGLVKQL